MVRHDSVPLTDIARRVLRYSNNLSAELIGLATSRALTGGKLSLAEFGVGAGGVVAQAPAGCRLDGTLSREPFRPVVEVAATPRQIVIMLEEAAGLPGGADFHDLLRPDRLEGRQRARRASRPAPCPMCAVSRLYRHRRRPPLAFAIFFNDAEKRAALDAAFDPHVRGHRSPVAALAQSRVGWNGS